MSASPLQSGGGPATKSGMPPTAAQASLAGGGLAFNAAGVTQRRPVAPSGAAAGAAGAAPSPAVSLGGGLAFNAPTTKGAPKQQGPAASPVAVAATAGATKQSGSAQKQKKSGGAVVASAVVTAVIVAAVSFTSVLVVHVGLDSVCDTVTMLSDNTVDPALAEMRTAAMASWEAQRVRAKKIADADGDEAAGGPPIVPVETPALAAAREDMEMAQATQRRKAEQHAEAEAQAAIDPSIMYGKPSPMSDALLRAQVTAEEVLKPIADVINAASSKVAESLMADETRSRALEQLADITDHSPRKLLSTATSAVAATSSVLEVVLDKALVVGNRGCAWAKQPGGLQSKTQAFFNHLLSQFHV